MEEAKSASVATPEGTGRPATRRMDLCTIGRVPTVASLEHKYLADLDTRLMCALNAGERSLELLSREALGAFPTLVLQRLLALDPTTR
jgi:hypothetical protein